MAAWDPAQYLKFADERARPLRDLLTALGPLTVRRAVDLGCGPGNSTAQLHARFPEADLLAIDTDEAMIAAARRSKTPARFVLDDIGQWQAAEPVDLVVANAALHWVPDHATLLPRLMAMLAPGGALAVQMPRNFEAASHRLAYDTALAGPWSARFETGLARPEVLPPERYYDILAPEAASVDVWETIYNHPLPDAGAIAEWTRGSTLLPILSRLDDTQRRDYLARYVSALEHAYGKRADGRVLLGFRRLFIIARRG